MIYKFLILFVLIGMSGCKTTNNPDDPLEHINRPIEGFNTSVDALVLKPASLVYRALLPTPVRSGIHKMFLNLGEIPNAINAGLQGQWQDFENSVERFSINTTCGFLGFFDRAIETGRERTPHDFGQTLYKWGYKRSAFVMLPFFGPSTIRDSFSILFDQTLLNPAMYINDVGTRTLVLGTQFISTKSVIDDKFEDIQPPEYFDRYVIFKDSYLQNREHFLNPSALEDAYDLDY